MSRMLTSDRIGRLNSRSASLQRGQKTASEDGLCGAYCVESDERAAQQDEFEQPVHSKLLATLTPLDCADLHWDVAQTLERLGGRFAVEFEAEDYSLDIAMADERIAIEVLAAALHRRLELLKSIRTLSVGSSETHAVVGIIGHPCCLSAQFKPGAG